MTIRKLTAADEPIFYEMCEEFFHSSAVSHPIPMAHHVATFQELLQSDGEPAGFAILNQMMQQEAGGIIIWVECLYVREAFRSQGIGRQFLQFVAAEWKGKAKQLRLEVEPNNVRAKALYERMGYKVLPYQEMILSLDEAE